MQIVQKSRHFFSILLVLILCAALLSAVTVRARAAELLPQELYVEQSRGGVCTLASATMLVRSTLYMNGNSHWSEITENDVAATAWIYGVGLRYTWSFETEYASISVEHTDLSGITEEALAALLEEHPEGIEFYCGGLPHAVFLTDYEDGVFYCSDPAPYCSGSRFPLEDSWLGSCLGSQDNILRNATAYWSVTACTVTADMDEIPLDALEEQTEETQVFSEIKEVLRSEQGKLGFLVRAMNA